jgi:YgiT-type zinc finger domain-containing protein
MSDYMPHACDFCPGTVRSFIARHEPIRVRGTVVLLEGVTIGKCDRCGHRYFPADVVKRADAVAQNPDRTMPIGILAA